MSESWHYSVLGLLVRADRPVPGLAPVPRSARADVDLHLGRHPPVAAGAGRAGDAPWYVSPRCDEKGTPTIIVWRRAGGRYFELACCDGARFVVDGSGREVWATWPPALTVEDAADYFLGLVLGFVLLLRGRTCLHASAVAVNGRAVAFVGAQGAGKSTTAAAFARRGYPVLADDLVALAERDGAFWAYPGHPQLRLWPQSVALLFGQPDALPRLSPSWDKRRLDLGDGGCPFQPEPLPLHRVYVLRGRDDDPVLPRLEEAPARDGLIALVGNTYLNSFLDAPMRAREFAFLSRLVPRLSMRFVTAHADPGRLPRLLDLVLSDLGAPPAPAPRRLATCTATGPTGP